jgi:APA family basic amino acid/polyamine antiporter
MFWQIWLIWLCCYRNPNAADIANNGIMFASNDRVGAAAASMIMGNVGVL